MGWGSGVAVSCDIGHRRSSDLELLWLWCRPAVIALIQPLAWELPYAARAAFKKEKKIFFFFLVSECISIALPGL